eukprot:7380459-Prymnesium_polylepis.1
MRSDTVALTRACRNASVAACLSVAPASGSPESERAGERYMTGRNESVRRSACKNAPSIGARCSVPDGSSGTRGDGGCDAGIGESSGGGGGRGASQSTGTGEPPGSSGGAGLEGRASDSCRSIMSASDGSHGRQWWLVHQTALPFARRSCRSPVPPRTRRKAPDVCAATSTSPTTK